MFYISNCTGGVGRHNDNDLKQIVVQGVHKMRLKTIRLYWPFQMANSVIISFNSSMKSVKTF